VSVLFCADPFIAKLNAQYRGAEGPTDVLSFATGEDYTAETGERRYSAGDIVVSLDTLAQNAAYFHVALDEELKRLLVHGILHLAGYDHTGHLVSAGHLDYGLQDAGQMELSAEEEMLRLQERLLTDLQDYSIIR
jgi:probable rRNA maturation factor